MTEIEEIEDISPSFEAYFTSSENITLFSSAVSHEAPKLDSLAQK